MKSHFTIICLLLYTSHLLCAEELCRIQVVDQDSGWPVPLVELCTTHSVRFVSDNAGNIAFDLADLMGVETWFHIEGHGYGVSPDGFGNCGVRLTPMPDTTLTVKVKRRLPAKRLGRITGTGLFGESQRLGLETEWKDQGILGCDTVRTALHKGRLHWVWGDTTLARYPLGLFHTLGATTAAHPLKSFEPPVRLRYGYYNDKKGCPRVVAKMPGNGPTWVGGNVSLSDKSGRSHLVAVYEKIQPPLELYEVGLIVWDEKMEEYTRHLVIWKKTPTKTNPPPYPCGHATMWTDATGKEWLLFGDPFPHLKCEPTFEAWNNPDSWQILKPQQTVPARGASKKVVPHRGSIAWNAYRKKWVTIFTQKNGTASLLGEIWYAEADSPLGPWGDAVKVLTHNKYTFYNPMLHPGLTPLESSILLFEGTYTKTFSNAKVATAQYDYNQILYRLDLDDPALLADLPVCND